MFGDVHELVDRGVELRGGLQQVVGEVVHDVENARGGKHILK